MTGQDLLEEIRSLRNEIGSLGDHMVRLRYADIRSAFLEQMRAAISETNRKVFHDDASVLRVGSQCEHKDACLKRLGEVVDQASDRVMEVDLAAAEKVLNDAERLIAGECSPCQDQECSRSASEAIRRVRAVLLAYIGLVERLGTPPGDDLVPLAAGTSPELVEAVLDPLANAWRLKVLSVLRRGDRSLTELGRAVDLRTGHLQFHLRKLLDAGYVDRDRRGRGYRLTERGAAALQWTEDIARRLGPAGKGQGQGGEWEGCDRGHGAEHH